MAITFNIPAYKTITKTQVWNFDNVIYPNEDFFYDNYSPVPIPKPPPIVAPKPEVPKMKRVFTINTGRHDELPLKRKFVFFFDPKKNGTYGQEWNDYVKLSGYTTNDVGEIVMDAWCVPPGQSYHHTIEYI